MKKLDNEDKAAGEGGEGEDEQDKADGEVRHPVQVQQELAPMILQLKMETLFCCSAATAMQES